MSKEQNGYVTCPIITIFHTRGLVLADKSKNILLDNIAHIRKKENFTLITLN